MTVVGNHLVCDCSKAIGRSSCPRQMISPMIKKSNTYFHCPHCNFDFICTQAIKIENGLDKFTFGEVTDSGIWKDNLDDLKSQAMERYKYLADTGIASMENWESDFKVQWDAKLTERRNAILKDPVEYLRNDPEFLSIDNSRERNQYVKAFYKNEFGVLHAPMLLSDSEANAEVEVLKNSPLLKVTEFDPRDREQALTQIDGIADRISNLYQEHGADTLTVFSQLEDVSSE